MNIQSLFAAAKANQGEHTLLVAAQELERQGYHVKIAGRFRGAADLARADEAGELDRLPVGVGVKIEAEKEGESQSFLLHFLDLGAICLTDLNTPPVVYDPKFTIGEFRSDDRA